MAKEKINILLLGAGGREHALLSKLAESPQAGKLWVAPGNGGMLAIAEQATCSPDKPEEVRRFAQENAINLVVIGPEAPLVAGVADACREAGIACFGPSAQAAQMEGSKVFAKEIMTKAKVPTAAYKSFTNEEEAAAYVKTKGAPIVIKADGLAAGKGVVVAETLDEALEGVHECFTAFGDAGNTVIVEEILEGPECSLLALTDGTTLVPLATSQDHKRALDNDKGPNTGGMGVYSPVPIVTEAQHKEMVRIMEKVVAQLSSEGISYTGCLYGGFMLTKDGPKVLEFNARFGDPETQVILPRMKADLLELLLACDQRTLDQCELSWDDDWALSVVLTSAGYPFAYETGKAITGIKDAEKISGVTVYHAGTTIKDGVLVTAGGRVLNVTAVAPTLEGAREKAYAACEQINFEGKTYRQDIGLKAVLANQEHK